MANTPKAPKAAPSQTVVTSGEGTLPKAAAVPAGSLAPKPRHAPTTGPKIPGPSVNYNSQQESAPSVVHLGASAADYANQQGQELQDKANG